jgi:very-short-patch-repair endonuclease
MRTAGGTQFGEVAPAGAAPSAFPPAASANASDIVSEALSPTSPLRGEVDAQRRVRGSASQPTTRPVATVRARSLRKSETDAERKLWSLRGRRLAGHKFVRQFPIGPCFADFACREAALVIEVDGSQHLDSSRDARRDAFLAAEGYSILRFWNTDVLTNLDGVAASILAALDLHPSPGERFTPATFSASPRATGTTGRFATGSKSPEGRGENGASAATAKARSRHLTAELPRLERD